MNSKITKEELDKYLDIDRRLEDICCDLADLIGDDYYAKYKRDCDTIRFDIYQRGCCGGDDEDIGCLYATSEDLSKDHPHRDLYVKFKIQRAEKERIQSEARARATELQERQLYERLKAKFGDSK